MGVVVLGIILSLVVAGVIIYIDQEIEGYIDLKKDLKPKNIRQIKVTKKQLEKLKNIEKEEIINKTFGKDMWHFLEVAKDNFSEEELNNLYKNISSLKIKEHLLCEHRGYYSPASNKIVLKKDEDDSLYHELFHMASFNDKCFGGFFQYEGNYCIGRGLNEGYTDLLTMRYFPIRDYESSYSLEVNIVKALEMMVGKDLMTELYLTADLKGLIHNLQKINSNQSIMRFINDVDFLNKYRKSKRNKEFVDLKIEEVLSFLKSSAINKLKKDIEFDCNLEDITVWTWEFSKILKNIKECRSVTQKSEDYQKKKTKMIG